MDYTQADYEFVSGFMTGWVPAGVSSNFIGTFDPNNPAPKDVVISEDQSNPAMFAAWDVEYVGAEGTFDPTDYPIRTGNVIVALYVQQNAGKGHILQSFYSLRQLFAAQTNEGPVVFSEDTAITRRVGYVGDMYGEVLQVPFTGV